VTFVEQVVERHIPEISTVLESRTEILLGKEVSFLEAVRNGEYIEWNSQQWFLQKFLSQGVEHPGAYFAHKLNGYSRFRHTHCES